MSKYNIASCLSDEQRKFLRCSAMGMCFTWHHIHNDHSKLAKQLDKELQAYIKEIVLEVFTAKVFKLPDFKEEYATFVRETIDDAKRVFFDVLVKHVIDNKYVVVK